MDLFDVPKNDELDKLVNRDKSQVKQKVSDAEFVEIMQEANTKRKAELATIEMAKKNWAEKHWMLWGIFMACFPIGVEHAPAILKKLQIIYRLLFP